MDHLRVLIQNREQGRGEDQTGLVPFGGVGQGVAQGRKRCVGLYMQSGYLKLVGRVTGEVSDDTVEGHRWNTSKAESSAVWLLPLMMEFSREASLIALLQCHQSYRNFLEIFLALLSGGVIVDFVSIASYNN
jgi:hypothetical protein